MHDLYNTGVHHACKLFSTEFFMRAKDAHLHYLGGLYHTHVLLHMYC